ncbi:PEP-utilizing enzyme, TIM barrel domain protein, partial [Vibrio harveyi]
CG